MNTKLVILTLLTSAVLLSFNAGASPNLIANGSFEEGSHSNRDTPTGWTNIGHSEGVISNSQFSTPTYDGAYFYDFGGYGAASGPIGDGIEQTVATEVGTVYLLSFGLTSEDVSNTSALRAHIGDVVFDFPLFSTASYLKKAFVKHDLTYVATSTSTTIKFIETQNASGGFNDPEIDGVVFTAKPIVRDPENSNKGKDGKDSNSDNSNNGSDKHIPKDIAKATEGSNNSKSGDDKHAGKDNTKPSVNPGDVKPGDDKNIVKEVVKTLEGSNNPKGGDDKHAGKDTAKDSNTGGKKLTAEEIEKAAEGLGHPKDNGKGLNPGEHVASIPEPETYAMLLAGLSVLGFLARRRKAAA